MGFAFGGPSYSVAQKPTANQDFYASAVAVWEQRLGIKDAINRLNSDIRGDAGTAKQIETFLNTVNNYLKQSGKVTNDELAILQGYIPKDLQDTTQIKGTSNNDLGKKMEQWLNKVFQQAIGTSTSFLTGDNKATSGIREEVGRIEYNIDVTTGAISLNKAVKETKNAIQEVVDSDMKAAFRAEANSLGYGIEKIASDQTSKVFLYQEWKDQKSDLDTTYTIEGDFQLEGLAALLANHTYSVKNYSKLSSGIHLGKAKNNRDLFSIYYYFTGDSSLSNAKRFVFSSDNSHDPGSINQYRTWASALYELTGAGTVSGQDLKNLRLVDFLIVHSGGNFRVYSTKEMLRGFPGETPSWFNAGSGKISSTFFNDSSFAMGTA